MALTVGKRIKALRAEKNLSLPDLAERAGVSKAFLSQIENDEQANPSLDTLNKVAKVLGVTLAELLEQKVTKARRIIPDEIDPGLKEFIDERHAQNQPLDENILQALYVLQQRKGQVGKTKQNWRWLYESIKLGVKP